MPKTFLVLGAGLAGLPLAHHVLKHYVDKYDFKLILVSRSDEFYWNIGAPRAAIPGQFTNEKVFYSIPQAFAKYPTNRFEFVIGSVESWDPDHNSVTVTQSNEHKRVLDYHVILVATGSDYNDHMPWKLVGTAQETHEALEKLRNEVGNAGSIIIGGGGPTGVEFAGELGYEYAVAGRKKVTLIISDSLPLEARIMEATRRAAKKELEKLNVTIIANTKITSTRTNAAGRKVLSLTNSSGTNSMLEADLFVPTWGIKFNTSFAPASMREPNGQLKVTKTLRAPGYDNAFLVGDAANLESYAAGVRETQVRYLATALGQYFAGGELLDFKPMTMIGVTLSVGRGRGVGQLGIWNTWSFLIWLFKGRHMCTNLAPDYVAGNRLVAGSL